jgi:hypothetical protein
MWRAFLWIVVVGLLWLAVGFAIVRVVDVSQPLPGDIRSALIPTERDDQLDLIHVDSFGLTGFVRGVQLAIFSFIFGGVPAAVFAVSLAAWRRIRNKAWSGNWENVFRAGFVFQVGSLLVTSLSFIGLVWAAYEGSASRSELLTIGGPLFLMVAGGIWGIRSWRALQGAVEPASTTVSLHQRA